MDAKTLRRDPLTLARLEARALEGMARALCEHSRQLLAAARERGALSSREARFQVEVFAERHAQAEALLHTVDAPAQESRIARLEKLVSALECSRGYFLGLQEATLRAGTSRTRGRSLCRWIVAGLGLSLTLGGCGLAGTGGAAATQATAAAQQAEAATRQLDTVRADLEAAQKSAADARAAAEAVGQ
jgi:hypothetical protein